MKKFSAIAVAFLGVMISACQGNESEVLGHEEFPESVESFTGVERDIMVNILTNRYGGYQYGRQNTRGMGEFTLSPYIHDGDTVFFVAQYASGWEIYSANHATNMILFSSEKGNFEEDYPDFPEALKVIMNENAEAIHDLSDTDTSYIDPSWGGIAFADAQLPQTSYQGFENGSYVPLSGADCPPGHWILLESEEIDSEDYTSPKLVKTKWGQLYPWNMYAKKVPNEKGVLQSAPTGCSPVAISQYQYFTHHKDGIPAYSVTGATPTSDGKDFTFYGSSSTVWDNMAIMSGMSGTNEAALLIGKTGRSLNTQYRYDGSSTMVSNELAFLTSTYGKKFSSESFSYFKVTKSIDKGYPIVASARTNKLSDGSTIKESGHIFLIDQYKQTTKTFRYKYGLVRDPQPEGAVNKWLDDFKDMDGNIILYAYTKSVLGKSIRNTHISMNWGESGAYDRIFYSPDTDWDAMGYVYNLSHKIYVREDVN